MEDTSSPLLEDSLLLIWNNRNAVERLTIMEKIYTPDIAFYEGNDSEPFVGLVPVNTVIAKLQEGWPAGFGFTLTGAPRINHNIQHISWALGAPGQPSAATGTDVAVIQEGKIKALYLFLDTKAE